MDNIFTKIKKSLFEMPPMRIILLGFLLVIGVGAVLLSLPVATQSGESTSFLDALFTSTSATCVTGLLRFDNYTHWSWFGKAVILVLIQIGGLGFMTMAISIVALTKARIGISTRIVMQNSISAPQVGGIVRLTKKIFLGTAIIESSGAVLLMPYFIPRLGVAKGIVYSVFHSVSAFCNAGFDLMGYNKEFSSLTAQASNWYFNIVIMLLVLIGGLGFVVWFDLIDTRFKFKELHLQSKLVLTVSGVLILVGAVAIFFFELNGTLFENMPLNEKILVSLFHSVMTRTAGFCSVNISSFTEPTIFTMMCLMLIGGSTGSTAGGLKTTTFAVLILSVVSVVRKRKNMEAFGRRLDDDIDRTASCLFVLYIFVSVVSAMIISSIEGIAMVEALLETMSAITTVGYTFGVTPALSVVSEVILMILMMLGRIGSVTVLIALFSNKSKAVSKLPYGEIQIG